MKTLLTSLGVAVALASTACGGSTVESPGGNHDAGATRDVGSDAPQPGTVIGPCGAGGTCPAGSTCYFAIGSCDAKGQCVENPAPGSPECKAIEEVCGCGTQEQTGCGYPGGFASGPALGPSDCMGTTSTTSGGESSSSGSGVTSSSIATSSTGSFTAKSSATQFSGSSSAASGCPAVAPAADDPCSVTYECEYGSDPDVSCDTVFRCVAGAWLVSSMPSTAGCSTTSSAGCPATYADVQAQDGQCAMADVGESCVYAEARCDCSRTCGMEGVGGTGGIWCCPDAPPGGSCPSPRPRLGTACTTSTSVCDYGACSGNVELQCTDGVWQKVTQFGCPG